MPCTYTGGGSLSSLQADELHFSREAADRLTRMLCWAARRLSEKDPLWINHNRELREWFNGHLEYDTRSGRPDGHEPEP